MNNSINEIWKRLREQKLLEAYDEFDRDKLIELAQDGDKRAMEILITTHQDFIRKMTSKYFLSDGDQDDLMQLATIGFWDAVESWDGSGNFEAFAGMIIKRQLTSAVRAENAEKRQLNHGSDSLDAPANDEEGGGSVGDNIAGSKLSAEDRYVGNTEEITKYMKEKFSPTEMEVVKKYIQGYKIPEIAEEMGIKYKAVENTLMRIRNKLTDYKNRRDEGKRIRYNSEIEFSDEEKNLLESVITSLEEELSESIEDEYVQINNPTLEDIKNSTYAESFMKDRAQLKIDGQIYNHLNINKWEYVPIPDYAIGRLYTDTAMYEKVQKAKSAVLLDYSKKIEESYLPIRSIIFRGKSYPIKTPREVKDELAGYKNELGLEHIATVKKTINGEIVEFEIYDSGVGNLSHTKACALIAPVEF